MRKWAVSHMLDEWTRLFFDGDYIGNNVLHLSARGKPLAPSHLDKGPWLSQVGVDNPLCARFMRAVLGHAPIGSYRVRFRKATSGLCSCGLLETVDHVIHRCPKYRRHRDPRRRLEAVIFLKFLRQNPSAFAFGEVRPTAIPYGDGRQVVPPDPLP